jgi:diguanylate cyclase (GGDEF)-like protein/PAS domain S-box-containing protein
MIQEKSAADNPFASGKTEDSIFWKIYQEAMDSILLVGFDNCVLDCNEAILLQLGFKDKSQLIGRSIGDFSPPCQPDGSPSVEKAAAYAENLLRQGRIRFEWTHSRDDGSLFEVETTAMVVTWQGQQISYSQLRDISEQKRLLKKLHESEETSRQIFEDAADPVAIFRQGILIDFNQAAVKQLGYATRESLLGLTPLDISAPVQADGRSTQEILPEMIAAAMQGRSGFEWRLRRRNGEEFDAEFTLTVITVNGEDVLHIRWHDLSEQKKLLKKLRESEEASQRIFDEAADPVVMFTRGLVSDCNRAALQQMGYQHKHELLGQTPLDMAPAMQADGQPTAELAAGLIDEALSAGSKSFDWLLQRKDGSIFEVEFTLTAITVNGEDVLHIRWRDVSKQKRLTRELHESEEAFRRIFDEAAAPILLFKNGYFVDGNLAATRLLDYPDKQMFSGKTPLDLAPPRQPNGQSSAEMVREMTLAALRQGHHHFAWQMQRMDGSLVDTEIPLTSITVHGELLIHAQVRDLTEQNRLQAALHAEKERAEITLASIGDAVITTDAEGHVTFLNHVASKLTGWAASEAIGRPVAEIFHIVNDNTREKVVSPVDEVLKKRKTVTLANHTVLIARDGKEYNIEDSAAPIFLNDSSLLGCVLVFHDASEKHALLKNVRWQAGHDVLTGLPNRVLLADRFERALTASRRQKNLLGVCLMDLDQFKPVNDLYGHNAGDQLLIEVTQRMNVAVRSEDTVARLGGDEFVLLLGNLADVPQLEMVLQRILAAVSAPYSVDGHTISISASIGVAIYPLDDADADTLLRHADQAMYLAKQAGRNRIHWFDVAHDRQAQTAQQTQARVREALRGNELRLYYQPKVNMRSGEVVGMEALLRWQHPQQGLLPPMDFLPAVEQTDLTIDIGEWVIEQALQQNRAWSAMGGGMAHQREHRRPPFSSAGLF